MTEQFATTLDEVLSLRSENAKLRRALQEIDATPHSMVNDSESLRFSIRLIKLVAHKALSTAFPSGGE